MASRLGMAVSPPPHLEEGLKHGAAAHQLLRACKAETAQHDDMRRSRGRLVAAADVPLGVPLGHTPPTQRACLEVVDEGKALFVGD